LKKALALSALLPLGLALTWSAALAPPVLGQEPPTGFVRKLGVDVDVRSGAESSPMTSRPLAL